MLSFVLIVPALATFVVGLASSGTLPLYISLVCSVVAGMALAVAARLRRGTQPEAETLALAPEETGEEEGEEPGAAEAPELVPVPDEAFAPPDASEFALDVQTPQIDIEIPTPPPRPRRAPAPPPPPEPAPEPKKRRRKRPPAVVLPPPSPPPAPSRPAAAVTYDDEGMLVFPIEDYDTLSAAQVVKVLKLLDSEEMETVREYEAEHQARPDVLDRIDHLLERRGLG